MVANEPVVSFRDLLHVSTVPLINAPHEGPDRTTCTIVKPKYSRHEKLTHLATIIVRFRSSGDIFLSCLRSSTKSVCITLDITSETDPISTVKGNLPEMFLRLLRFYASLRP
jgi:hypothetical protein